VKEKVQSLMKSMNEQLVKAAKLRDEALNDFSAGISTLLEQANRDRIIAEDLKDDIAELRVENKALLSKIKKLEGEDEKS